MLLLWPQAVREHERATALKPLMGRYLALLADRLTAAPTDIDDSLPRIYAALGPSPLALPNFRDMFPERSNRTCIISRQQ